MVWRTYLVHVVPVVVQVLTVATFGQAAENSGPQRQDVFEYSVANHNLLRNGEPFFWLADTGWCLFQQSPDDVESYLDDRAAKHFNVIQMMMIRTRRESNGLEANYAGELPFTSLDPITLNEVYWRHVDFILDTARERGLAVAPATMWGRNADSLFPNPLENNEAYGTLLGRRYRDRDNVIWLVTGEYEKINDNWREDKQAISDEQRELIRAIAHGLETGHGGKHLMTIHPVGTSSDDFHHDGWLDFNMHQTWGHASANVHRVRADCQKRPAKPVLNGEPGYENRPETPTSTAWKCRYEGYWSVFSGACGYTYGAWPVWCFQAGWQEALQYEGANDMRHLRFLIESRPMRERIPDQSLLMSEAGSLGSEPSYRAATRTSDGSCVMVYSTMGKPFTVDLRKLSAASVNVWWYSPRDGRCYDEHARETADPFEKIEVIEPREFTPPTAGIDQDWVAVFDDATAGFSAPGVRNSAAH